MPASGWLESLSYALSLSENKAYVDALGFLNSLLPDNENFTALDCADWERRLGLIFNPLATLPDRKAAIRRKYNHPGTIPARQHYLYIQDQLRAAGFDVYVFENRIPDGMGGYNTTDPITLAGSGGVVETQHGGTLQHGDAQHGGQWGNLVVNSLDVQVDQRFDVGANLRSTFFIGGTPLGTYAYVPTVRLLEFRQLILKLKPAHTVAYLFIIYV